MNKWILTTLLISTFAMGVLGSTKLLDDSFVSLFNSHSDVVYNKSGIRIHLFVDSFSPVVTSSQKTISIVLLQDSVLFFTSSDLNGIMSENEVAVLSRNSALLLEQKRYQEVVELLFLNYVDQIARDSTYTFSELLETTTTDAILWWRWWVVLVVGFTIVFTFLYLVIFKKYQNKQRYSSFFSWRFFGKPLVGPVSTGRFFNL